MRIKRVSKEKYYMGLAREAARRAVCFRRFSGAVIVREDQIVSTGYTGSPRKTLDCFERKFCLRNKLNIPSGQRYELCASVHAEQNAFINAGRAGVSFLGGDIYIFGQTRDRKPIDAFPCFICKKLIINAGLKRVICSTKEKKMRTFLVEAWVEEWKDPSRNIVDDDVQYGVGLKI